MTLQELVDKVGDENQIIALLVNNEWVGIFPAMHCPCQYDDYVVEAIIPNKIFCGDPPFDELVLKVLVKEPT